MKTASPLRSTPTDNPGKLPAGTGDVAVTENRMRRRVVFASILGNGL